MYFSSKFFLRKDSRIWALKGILKSRSASYFHMAFPRVCEGLKGVCRNSPTRWPGVKEFSKGMLELAPTSSMRIACHIFRILWTVDVRLINWNWPHQEHLLHRSPQILQCSISRLFWFFLREPIIKHLSGHGCLLPPSNKEGPLRSVLYTHTHMN